MAYDGWLEYGGVEVFNLSRSAQLAEVMGIDMLWTDPASVAWIEQARGGQDYDDVTKAPWYDASHIASTEFAGFIPLSVVGLDDSTREATSTEYLTSGGVSSRARNKTLPVVVNLAVLASTERGADYGKQWLDRVLMGSGLNQFCSGWDLRYYRTAREEGLPVPPLAHRRNVTLTRGTTVTRKRANECSVAWITTFTWTANDPFEYGEPALRMTDLGGAVQSPPGGPVILSSGSFDMVYADCPDYDYTPIYDPLYPALVAPPTAPDFYPDGWLMTQGSPFVRHWARISSSMQSAGPVVPLVAFATGAEARMVRISVWPKDAAIESFCEPLWQAIVTYMPAGVSFFIDGEQEASYVVGASPVPRRTDSLVYTANGRPMAWERFLDSEYLVTLDLFYGFSDTSGLLTSVSLINKND